MLCYVHSHQHLFALPLAYIKPKPLKQIEWLINVEHNIDNMWYINNFMFMIRMLSSSKELFVLGHVLNK